MSDPLSEVVRLLRPRTVFAKGISGAGHWDVRYSAYGQPSFCLVLEGSCRLSVDGEPPLTLRAGNFVLLPATPGFTLSSSDPAEPKQIDPKLEPMTSGELRHGDQDGPADVRLLGGAFLIDTPDPELLASVLPAMIHISGAERFEILVRLVGAESAADKPGRELVLSRLVEVLLIEALRLAPTLDTPPGLLRGLSDERLAPALRAMHEKIAFPWTVGQLAKVAALSRSSFFGRFSEQIGVPPMMYLLSWRMAVAKDLLRHQGLSIAEVAERIGYSSASTFSTAFSRHAGLSPSRYMRGS